ncbi:carboxylesterase/lipase family protein [Bacillus massiliglaciei]|uniref:carboxylesterase/lipase family protein n=1 Tax=Bacillus massiliglaciei TaxID=1816693 RepID=UPI0018FE106D|nr:carboxylesterase family protein [Bacillus massiliglaciei]
MIGSIVTTAKGHIQGVAEGQTYVWKGIRYAKAPTGERRFQAPEPMDAWDGVADAKEFSPQAPQSFNGSVGNRMTGNKVPDEDCLFLNVWVPKTAGDKLPVMVWIPGGANTAGSGLIDLYNGKALAEAGNIVVVTINYRMGALGYLDFSDFLDTETVFDSNIGLRDQVASLKWVNENIAAFGGDPERVTVWGESAGGDTVTALLTIPSAKGLFSGAIAQNPAPSSAPKSLAKKLAKRFLELAEVSEDDVDVLKTLPIERITEAAELLRQENSKMRPGTLTFAPVVDGEFLPVDPLEAVYSGKAGDLPLLIGINRNMPLGGEETRAEVPIHTIVDEDPELDRRVTAPYRKLSDKKAVMDTGGNARVNRQTVWFTEGYSKQAKMWMCHFNIQSGSFQVNKGNSLFPLRPWRNSKKLSEKILSHWLNFAKYGTPNPPDGEIWPVYDTENRYTMRLDEPSGIEKDPYKNIREACMERSAYK